MRECRPSQRFRMLCVHLSFVRYLRPTKAFEKTTPVDLSLSITSQHPRTRPGAPYDHNPRLNFVCSSRTNCPRNVCFVRCRRVCLLVCRLTLQLAKPHVLLVTCPTQGVMARLQVAARSRAILDPSPRPPTSIARQAISSRALSTTTASRRTRRCSLGSNWT